MPHRTAAMLVVGNEILTGKVEEKNARYVSSEFFKMGVELRRILVVPDEIDVIAEAVKALADTHDIVFTSGGVGPTHDDVTVAGVAQGLGRALERNAKMVECLEEIYGEHCNEHVLTMADIPSGTELVEGDGLRVPVMVVDNVHVFPGIPELFRVKFDAIRARFEEAPFVLESIYTLLDESALAEPLARITAEHPSVGVGSYPVWNNPHYRVKVTFESKDAALVSKAAGLLREIIPEDKLVPPPPEPGRNEGAGS